MIWRRGGGDNIVIPLGRRVLRWIAPDAGFFAYCISLDLTQLWDSHDLPHSLLIPVRPGHSLGPPTFDHRKSLIYHFPLMRSPLLVVSAR